MFVIVDNFLQLEYQESYNSWKSLTYSETSKFANDVKNMEEQDVAKYQDMEDYWTTYGPIASVIFIVGSFAVFGSIFGCYRMY